RGVSSGIISLFDDTGCTRLRAGCRAEDGADLFAEAALKIESVATRKGCINPLNVGAGFRANGGDQDRTQTVDGQHLDAPSFALTSAKTSSKSRRERACRSSAESCGGSISTSCS